MTDTKVIVYGHAGSANHGNEAIVRGLSRIFEGCEIAVFSYEPGKDKQWGLEEACKIEAFRGGLKRFSPINLLGHLEAGCIGSDYIRMHFWHKALLKQGPGIYLLEAGDQYCENKEILSRYAYLNRQMNKRGFSTVAYGMSINTEVLENQKVIKDLKNYARIIMRESLSYDALKNKGIETAELIPDPAFAMPPKQCGLPEIFKKGGVIGITFGYMAQGKEKHYEKLKKSMETLMAYILEKTEFSIALIPHVNIGKSLNDIEPLRLFYEKFSSKRVELIAEHRADEQKYIISKCRFMITLRTHASIAAYSSLVPTLVLGYSIKSKGIAKDIFGSYQNYVRSVEELSNDEAIIKSFCWLLEQEEAIRDRLGEVMPKYIAASYKGKQILERKLCTGCRACEQLCPSGAIVMKENTEGFLYPSIDIKRCVGCGLCNRRCPIHFDTYNDKPRAAYGFCSSDSKNLEQCSSGGVFLEAARRILGKGGVVFGAVFDKEMRVISTSAETEADVKKMCGSKYVQSDTGRVYKRIEELLKQERPVLYCAVPCQIAGLKAYLGRDYQQLYLIDLLCHGTPSPALFLNYLKWLEKKHGGRIKEYRFREKEYGWEAKGSFIIGKQKFKADSFADPYYCSFLQGKTFRTSCYSCQYAKGNRTGDITIGDFWGIRQFYPEADANQGVSAVLVNTKKGAVFFERLKENNMVFETSFDKIAKGNRSLLSPETEPKERALIYKNIGILSFEKLANRYLYTAPKSILRLKKLIPLSWKKRIRIWLQKD